MMTQKRVKCQHKDRQDGRDFGKVITSKPWFSSLENGYNHHYPNELPLELLIPVEGEERDRVGVSVAAGSSPSSCLPTALCTCCRGLAKGAGHLDL